MKRKPPSIRLHKPSGRAVVTLNGRDFYLGPHGSRESEAEHDRLVAEWLANGRAISAGKDITVAELARDYLKHCDGNYRRADG